MDKHHDCGDVTMPRDAFEELLEEVAKRAVEKAFADAGVADAVKLAKRVDGISDKIINYVVAGLVGGVLLAIWSGVTALAKAKGGG